MLYGYVKGVTYTYILYLRLIEGLDVLFNHIPVINIVVRWYSVI